MRILEGHEHAIADNAFKACLFYAKASTCHRSRCASVIVDIKRGDIGTSGHIIGLGYNSMPLDCKGVCIKDHLSSTFKSDKTCCVHAEQRAIMDCLTRNPNKIKGSTLYFLRIDDEGNMLKAGKPYCTICSKMALDVGIKEFVLWHEEGITAYDTLEYNNLSFQYK